MQKPGGIGTLFLDGNIYEHETSTCAHCQHITDIPSRKRMHEFVDVCRSCNKLICVGCSGKPCTPWEKEMERQEKRYMMLKDMGLA